MKHIRTAYILGAGPTGLAIADAFSDIPDVSFVLIEQEAVAGGLARTLQWEDHGTHDLGPHKLFTLDAATMARVEKLLPPNNWLSRTKKSAIYLNGHFLPYPPSPFSLINAFGTMSFLAVVFDFIAARLRSEKHGDIPITFEADLTGRVGRKLYELLFKPIALKLWGDPATLDVQLSERRVRTPSFTGLVSSLINKNRPQAFEAKHFRYPQGGLQTLWDAILRKTTGHGTSLFNHEVTAITAEDGWIKQLALIDKGSGAKHVIQVAEDDFVFSTIPVMKLAQLLAEPELIKATDQIVRLNDLILVFLKIDIPSLLPESWVFVPDDRIVFHRISEQESFDPEMTPTGSIVCCEIMDNPSHPVSNLADHELISMVKQGVADMGYTGFSIRAERVIRLPASYPVYRAGFDAAWEKLLAQLDAFANLRTIGRQGAFNYIGILDAIDIGYGAARWLLESEGTDEADEAWRIERLRTKYYPILD